MDGDNSVLRWELRGNTYLKPNRNKASTKAILTLWDLTKKAGTLLTTLLRKLR